MTFFLSNTTILYKAIFPFKDGYPSILRAEFNILHLFAAINICENCITWASLSSFIPVIKFRPLLWLSFENYK